MTIQFYVGKIGQTRMVQDPQRLIEHTEGRYRDDAMKLSDEQKYPVVNKSPDPRPFVVRERVGG